MRCDYFLACLRDEAPPAKHRYTSPSDVDCGRKLLHIGCAAPYTKHSVRSRFSGRTRSPSGYSAHGPSSRRSRAGSPLILLPMATTPGTIRGCNMSPQQVFSLVNSLALVSWIMLAILPGDPG